MARPTRIQYPGAFYLVTGIASERTNAFRGEDDYAKFMKSLREAKEKFGVIVHGYMLLRDLYHLVIETPEANLSRFMHYVIGSYTGYVNSKRGRSGNLFQGRYKAILIDKETHLLELSRYLHLIPVKEHLAPKPEAYTHSSHRAYILGEKGAVVSPGLILGMISGDRKAAAQRYRAFVQAGMGKDIRNPVEKVYGSVIAGSPSFVKNVLRRVDRRTSSQKGASRKQVLKRPGDLDDVMSVLSSSLVVPRQALLKATGTERDLAILFLKKYTDLTNSRIGALFGGLTYSAVTKICSRLVAAAADDTRLARQIGQIEKALSLKKR